MTVAPVDGNQYGAVEQYRQQQGPGNGLAMPAQFAPANDSFSVWIDNARQLAPIADSLARTSFVPKPFQGKPAEVVAAILAGQEMGFSPMASLRMIDVIEGKPGMSAIGLRALVQSHGHDIWTVESNSSRAIVKGRRKGSAREETSTWTIDRAKQLELTGKSNWKKQPTNMLLARATSEVARLVAADVIAGMPYSSEELADGFDGDTPEVGTDATPEAAPVKRTVKRKPLERMESAEPAPEPVGTPAASPAPASESEPEKMSANQRGRMFALFAEKGIASPAAQRQYVAEVLGREIESRGGLSPADADEVIAALVQLPKASSADDADPDADAGWPDATQIPMGDEA